MDEINEYEKILDELEIKIKNLKEELEKNKKINVELKDKYIKLKTILEDKKRDYKEILEDLKILLIDINGKFNEIEDMKKRIYNLELKVDLITKNLEEIRKDQTIKRM